MDINESAIRELETLAAWNKSRELRIQISRLSRSLPVEEKFRLSDQMIRASRSVTANLAEGYGRFHYMETVKFCSNARGSLVELLDHLYVCLDEEYIQVEQFESHKKHIED
jgi:four helix bundle protein